MSNYYKDPRMLAYLQHLRDRNIERSRYCHICRAEATGINSDGYRILFVCDQHMQADPNVIIEQDENIVHITYPEGKYVPMDSLDENQGGFLGRSSKYN